MKNRGFTLIELLAVIVILSIIALIATPIILNIIDNTKEQSVIRSIDHYMSAVTTTIGSQNLKDVTNGVNPDRCEIIEAGNKIECFKDDTFIGKFDVKVDGDKPNDGTIYFKKGKIDTDKENRIVFDNQTYTINEKGEIVKDDDAPVELQKYTVTFNSNGGSDVASQTIEDGKKASKPTDPTRDGYTFVGWKLNGSDYDFNAEVKGNITLEAQWTENPATVTKACSLVQDNDSNGAVSKGDKITCGTESFYVISNEGGQTQMLAEYNLKIQ